MASVKLTAGPPDAESNLVCDVTTLLRQLGVTNACVEVLRDQVKLASPSKMILSKDNANGALGELGIGHGPLAPAAARRAGDGVEDESLLVSANRGHGGAARKLSMDRLGGDGGSGSGREGVAGRADRVLRQIQDDESRGLLGLGLGGVEGEEVGEGGGAEAPSAAVADWAVHDPHQQLSPPHRQPQHHHRHTHAQGSNGTGLEPLLHREASDPEPPYHAVPLPFSVHSANGEGVLASTGHKFVSNVSTGGRREGEDTSAFRLPADASSGAFTDVDL